MANKRKLRTTTPAENHRQKVGETQVNVDLPKELATALKRYCKIEGAKRKIVIAKAVLRFLIKEGALGANRK